jgi:hypothetical protein
VLELYRRAGLGERDAAIAAGVLGDMRLIISERKGGAAAESYVNEMGEADFAPPASFGAPRSIYGGDVGGRPLGPDYLRAALARPRESVAGTIWDDELVRAVAAKAAAKPGAFKREVKEVAERLCKVGTRYTGGKVEALLTRD